MKFILKYKIKSKYFGFVKEYYKEFNNTLDIFHFIINNQLVEWKVYEQKDYEISDLIRRINNESSSN